MALAKQCDRCGKLYMPYHTRVRNYRINGFNLVDRDDDNSDYRTREYIDLCPDCMEMFSNWLDYFKEKEND